VRSNDNVIQPVAVTQASGLAGAALAVLIFSMTLPMSRLALRDFTPVTLVLLRALVPGLLMATVFLLRGERWPDARTLARLAVVTLGVVLGFPLLTSVALRQASAMDLAVVVAAMPFTTAVLGAWRGRERPSRTFWLAALAGLAVVAGFAALRGGRLPLEPALLTLGAVLVGSLGYVEGGLLARQLGGFRVICWALVAPLPLVVAGLLVFGEIPARAPAATSWLGLLFVALVSMLFGMYVWYRGMALAGVARVSQLQLAQPVLTLFSSAALLGEGIPGVAILAAGLVAVCLAVCVRART
jgi:drug/metabolite transporter (DMT)-like permease